MLTEHPVNRSTTARLVSDSCSDGSDSNTGLNRQVYWFCTALSVMEPVCSPAMPEVDGNVCHCLATSSQVETDGTLK